ncbi:hypothetical protein [Rhodococcus erythropolis]|uniref:hypothetical protein n=1 Tax=Rhodococcus erythropolis TaxID=1833 RepID=UPI0037F9DE67
MKRLKEYPRIWQWTKVVAITLLIGVAPVWISLISNRDAYIAQTQAAIPNFDAAMGDTQVEEYFDPATSLCTNYASDPPIVRCSSPETVAVVNCDVKHQRDQWEVQRLRSAIDLANSRDDFDILREYEFLPASPYPVDCYPNQVPQEPESAGNSMKTPR